MQKSQLFRNMLLSALQLLPTPPTDEEVEKKAELFASSLEYTEDLSNIINEVKALINTSMGTGVMLVSQNAQHDPLWLDKNTFEWNYNNAYSSFLQSEGWPAQVVNSLSDTTKQILTHLQNPSDEGSWSRRGLVVGHVQSGKTANYTGLIARAADVGYKFIIVIAGIHNTLRSQTQARIDESFVGHSSAPGKRQEMIGVALRQENYNNPYTVTNIHDDFNKSAARASGWKLGDFSRPIIFVIKKNVHILEALYEWLKEMNVQNNSQITDVPLLMIDDEADNASINTNKEESDPTRTNAGIRSILNLFSKSAYIGYTATPFANIFIDPFINGGELEDDLFPRDFIYCLDAPTNYFGPNKVFGEDDESSDTHIRFINDAEEYIPLSHKKDDEIHELPPSLYRALNSFILARAIRNLKGQRNQHCSMMVNVSRFVNYQREVRAKLSLSVNEIKIAVLSNSGLPDTLALKDQHMLELKATFDIEYSEEGFSWDTIKAELPKVFNNFRTFLINSASGEALNFSQYDQENVGLTALAVGGLSLSRGLTIEGLTISYLYRNTQMYDTLMQMGRWFGYRPNYESLCRVYLSNDSYNWYTHIAEASEELIQQVHEMSRQGQTPSDFGLVVRTHPSSLKITAPNKMLNAEQITMKQSYSGRLFETYRVSLDPSINKKNFELIREYWRNNFYSNHPLSKPDFLQPHKGEFYTNIPLSVIEEFLEKFIVHRRHQDSFSFVLQYLKEVRKRGVFSDQADVLLISPKGGSGGHEPYTMRNQNRRIEESQYKDNDLWTLSRSRVAGVGDEQWGLTPDEKKQAEQYFKEEAKTKEKKPKSISDYHYRNARNRVLLMLHSLMPTIDDEPVNLDEPVAAFGIAFPKQDSKSEKASGLCTVDVVANRIWLQNELNLAREELLEQQDEDE